MINTFPELILSKVCEYYKVDKSKVKGQLKKKEYVKARQVFSFLCGSMTLLTREKIGEIINRDHSSITHSISKINALSTIYPDINFDIKQIRNLIELINCSIEVKNVDLLNQAEMNTKFLNSWAIQ